jgi:cell division septal protein FtsQ
MARVALPDSRSRTRRKRHRVILFFVLFASVLALIGCFVWLSQASFLRITHINVSGTQTIASSTVEELVQTQMEGNFFYLFPKNNILFYPKGEIASALLAEMPVLASVSVSAENFQTISVAVAERQPKALWCGEVVASSSQCLLLDESGVAYREALIISGDAYTKYYGALTGSTTPKQYLSPAQFRSLSALVDTIAANQKNDPLESVLVDENNDVHMAFASGFTLLFALSVDGGDVYQRFTLAFMADPFKTHKLSDFEYLDLRFGDKLYYKLKVRP